jgi:hypothetical protein
VKVAFGLLALVRGAAADASERRLVAAAAVVLMRQRRRTLSLAAPLLAILPSAGRAKLQLWRSLAAAALQRPVVADHSPSLLAALKATQAYADVQARLVQAGPGVFLRGVHYRALLQRWCEAPPERLLIFHHYDRRGLLPGSWREALQAMQAAGWQVVVSSSDLQTCEIESLEMAGCQVALRTNIGLCLGAYRDLSLLLLSKHQPTSRLRSLVLCNDSNVPLQQPSTLLGQLQAWCSETGMASEPVLSGLTDSAQRACYHLQSFCLHANRALLQHPAWLRFWLGFSLQGSKDDLINHGEIGLSQALLAAGVQLRPAYPLMQGLLEDPAMAEELQRYSIWQPRHVNQSLFAWQSLLARGFPLVKKHVLFELIENQGLPMAMAELSRWIPEERRALLAADLQQLFVSRYSGGVPEMG